jgi:MraZ protein
MMFFGEYRYNLDPKGRVSIPGKFREVLVNRYQEILMVTRDFDQCLVAYPPEEWSRILEKAKGFPMTNPNVKKFNRHVIAAAMECPLDKQGRILIPSNLRMFAKLNKEVVLLGMDYKIEIWDYNLWKENEEQINQSREQISVSLADLGL